jgi:hypothetical protein
MVTMDGAQDHDRTTAVLSHKRFALAPARGPARRKTMGAALVSLTLVATACGAGSAATSRTSSGSAPAAATNGAGGGVSGTKTAPTISNSPDPTQLQAEYGQTVTLKDTAILSGGHNPTGSIDFKLYSEQLCGDGLGSLEREQAIAVSGDGNHAISFDDYAIQDYSWQVTYRGDSNNAPASSPCEIVNIYPPS